MNTLQVTSTQVFPIANLGITKAFARVVLNEQLQLTGLIIIEETDGTLSVRYPKDSLNRSEDWLNIFYPTTNELREHIQTVVILAYKDKIKASAK